MKIARHLLKMTLKIYKERGARATFSRIFLFLKELAKGAYLLLFFGFVFIKNRKSKDILYVSGCPGGSRTYRCDNQADELEKYELTAMVVSQNNPILFYLVSRFKVFIFQRVIYDRNIERIITKIKKQKKPIFFETDDLVYDPDFTKNISGFDNFSEQEKKWYSNGISREIIGDSYVKDCIVSTHFLKEKIQKKYPDKNIFVSTNKMGSKQVKWAEKFYQNKNKYISKDGRIRIGYFSGSKSHDRDFETIKNVLLKLLEENEKIILMIVGYLKLSKDFEKFENQIERYSFVPIKKLSCLIIRADINIAPLEIDNPFCQAKSALKYFESGILGIPTIATATDSFNRVIENEKNGFLAKKEEDWYEHLKKLIDNPDLRIEMGKTARADALGNYTTQKIHSDTKELALYMKNKFIL